MLSHMLETDAADTLVSVRSWLVISHVGILKGNPYI